MSASDVSQKICLAPSFFEAKQYFEEFHNLLFGTYAEGSCEVLGKHVDSLIKEFQIDVRSKVTCKAVNFSPQFLIEACLLIAKLLLSVVNHAVISPSVEKYLSRLENILLPQIFLRTKVSPQDIKNSLLVAPLQMFYRCMSEQCKCLPQYPEVINVFNTLKINFGIDVLSSAENFSLSSSKAYGYTNIQVADDIPVCSSSNLLGVKKEHLNEVRKNKKILSTPAYLLKKRSIHILQEQNNSEVTYIVPQAVDYVTPLGSDDDVLVDKTPEKRRRVQQ